MVEFTFTSGRQAAVPLEPRGAVAAFDPATGRVTLSASTQMPHLLRTGIADALGIPESELRVVAPEVGGGFGQKMALIPEYVVAVWAARRLELTRDPGMGLLCDSAVHCTPCFPSAAVPGGDPRDNRA